MVDELPDQYDRSSVALEVVGARDKLVALLAEALWQSDSMVDVDCAARSQSLKTNEKWKKSACACLDAIDNAGYALVRIKTRWP